MASATSLIEEYNQKCVREKLNQDKIKLWLPPYTTNDGQKGEMPQELVEKYSKELQLSQELLQEILEQLRIHALQKLAERDKFQKSGLASLKVRISGKADGTNDKAARSSNGSSQTLSIEISLSATGWELRQKVAHDVGIPVDQTKIICNGHIVNGATSLQDQGIKNGCRLLLLCLSVTEAEASRQQEQISQLMETRHAAELLSARAENEDDDEYSVQIADQSGRPLQLPPEERKALTLAMTLHEKGRTAMKRKEVNLALSLLLEADKEFRRCSAGILTAVDNYAVLCLDIVWCYLHLKNIEELPDAAERLKKSEECFHKSYGLDLSRLTAVKGETGTQLALYVRLHLLQGIVAFHQHNIPQAHHYIQQAEQELNRLDVDGATLTEVMTMGFSEREARLALRASNGDLQGAVVHIMKRREEKEDNKKKAKDVSKRNRLAKILGNTASGARVNVENYELLVSMGFPKGASAEALRQANNDVSQALEVLQNHPNLLSLPDPSDPKPNMEEISDELVAQIIAMGFDPEMARRALAMNWSNLEKAMNDLIQRGGVMPPLPTEFGSSSSSSASGSTPSSAGVSPTKSPKELAEEKLAIGKLVLDLPEDEEDYIDLTLTEEAQLLQEYKSLLESLNKT
ncbi:hypothetical protein ACJMK2_013345 [Sinanodonta woodiana]|uniref:NEDD8 ultimate buster 1 n=1 Tax=Sinanodonta woodiana TaxID=1069815 RepID=A0ABD3UX89_SINWO